VAAELASFGFRWFGVTDPEPLAEWLHDRDSELLAHNHQVAATHFNLADLPERLASVLRGAGISWDGVTSR
jgi:hypothetical protein